MTVVFYLQMTLNLLKFLCIPLYAVIIVKKYMPHPLLILIHVYIIILQDNTLFLVIMNFCAPKV